MMEKRQRHKSAQGEVELTLLLRAGVLSAVISGYMDQALGAAILDEAAKLAGDGLPFCVFLDFTAMTGFDDSVRHMMRRFKAQYGKRLTAHILTSAQLHTMLISVGRLMLGETLVGHTERRLFDAARGKALVQRSGGR